MPDLPRQEEQPEPDRPTTTIFSEEEQAPEAWYSWQFTPAPGEPVQTFEFGMAMPELDASNKIAKYLGIETLPDGSKLEHPEVTPLEARMMERDAQGQATPDEEETEEATPVQKLVVTNLDEPERLDNPLPNMDEKYPDPDPEKPRTA